jgi:hypothetical protein
MSTNNKKNLKPVVLGDLTFIKPKEMTEGQVLAGRYAGAKVFGDYDNPTFLIEQEDGSTVGLNSTSKLSRLMEKIPKGSYVEITYEGTGIAEKGKFKGKEYHDFSVAADTSSATESVAAPAAPEADIRTKAAAAKKQITG